jgi:hypothetical protein
MFLESNFSVLESNFLGFYEHNGTCLSRWIWGALAPPPPPMISFAISKIFNFDLKNFSMQDYSVWLFKYVKLFLAHNYVDLFSLH